MGQALFLLNNTARLSLLTQKAVPETNRGEAIMRPIVMRLSLFIAYTTALLTFAPFRHAVSAEGEILTPAATQEVNLDRSNLRLGGHDIGFQPRVYGGVMYYEYKQDAFISDTSGEFRPGTLAISSAEKFEAKTTLPIVGGGGTFFVDRFFVDVYAQHAFSQSDSDTQRQFDAVSLIDDPQNAGSFTNQQTLSQDFDLERTEWAVSAGYAITNKFSLFAGYRRADTDFDIRESGQLAIDDINTTLTPPAERVRADITSDTKQKFEQDGPFVGFVFGGPLKQWIFDGVLSFDLAVAFLDGDVKQETRNVKFTHTVVDGRPVPDSTGDDTDLSIDGDAVGLNLGLHWRGFTPIKRLSYLIDIVGHQYDFSADEAKIRIGDSTTTERRDFDFQEVLIAFRLGFSYAF
jgi:hypothetical protein